MSKTPTTEGPAVIEAAPRRAPEIDPASVKLQHAGHRWKWMEARMPVGLISDDLRDPAIWRRVQQNASIALCEGDSVRIFAFDRSWMVPDAVVAQAGPSGATLLFQGIKSMPERQERLPSDDKYFGRWNGLNYQLVRRADEHVVTTVATVPALERALDQQYPRLN